MPLEHASHSCSRFSTLILPPLLFLLRHPPLALHPALSVLEDPVQILTRCVKFLEPLCLGLPLPLCRYCVLPSNWGPSQRASSGSHVPCTTTHLVTSQQEEFVNSDFISAPTIFWFVTIIFFLLTTVKIEPIYCTIELDPFVFSMLYVLQLHVGVDQPPLPLRNDEMREKGSYPQLPTSTHLDTQSSKTEPEPPTSAGSLYLPHSLHPELWSSSSSSSKVCSLSPQDLGTCRFLHM